MCVLGALPRVEVQPVHWTGPSPTQMQARRRARVHPEGYRGCWHQRWGPHFQVLVDEEVVDVLLDVLTKQMPVPRLGVGADSTM